MNLKSIKAMLEAVLFAMAEPVTVPYLAEVLEQESDLLETALKSLQDEYRAESHGIQLLRLEGAWQFATKLDFAAPVQKVLDTRRNTPLSSAALEVLAIIAYNQPVSRSFIEQVRGVDSISTVGTLVQKGLVEEAGRLDLPGKPIAYKTNDTFLRCFGLTSLSELPPLHTEETVEGQITIYESLHEKQMQEEETAAGGQEEAEKI